MNKYRLVQITILVFFFFALAQKPIRAQSLTFDPTTKNLSAGDTLSVNILIDTGGQNTTGADALITFDNNVLDYSDVASGDFYTTGYKSLIAPGKLLVGMSQTDVSNPKKGNGVLATVLFKGKGVGSTTVSFICSTGKADSNIISATDSSDIIDCTKVNTATYTVAAGGGTNPTIVPSGTPSPTKAPTQLPKTGTVEVTIGLIGLGVLLSIVGLVLII